MASTAAAANTGLPPITVVSFNFPLGATTASTLTIPLNCILRASSGYTGTTLLTTFRFASGWSCGRTNDGENTTTPKSRGSSAAAARCRTVNFLTRLAYLCIENDAK